MRTTARIVVPIILIVSISLFVEGHNLPGGGFIGGVLTVTAFGLIYMAFGLEGLEQGVLDRAVDTGSPYEVRTVVSYRRLFTAGLAIVVASGLTPLLFEYPFLTQTFRVFEDIPLYHHIEIASAVAFDLGVYCVVVGGLLTILSVVGAE